MPSRLSHCLLLAFIGLALVQISYAAKLHAHSTTHQWSYVVPIESDLSDIIASLKGAQLTSSQQTVASPVTCFSGTDKGYMSFGKAAGQFGASDFSVGLWIKTTEAAIKIFDILGNRYASGTGNYFSLRMLSQVYPGVGAAGSIIAEVSQDSSGTNYIRAVSQGNLNDGKWHYIAVVRQGTSLSLYIDGALASQASGKGVANINNSYDFRIGRSLAASATAGRWTGAACYSGISIERRAWAASEIATKYSTTRPQ